jgi:hypothetical protein
MDLAENIIMPSKYQRIHASKKKGGLSYKGDTIVVGDVWMEPELGSKFEWI